MPAYRERRDRKNMIVFQVFAIFNRFSAAGFPLIETPTYDWPRQKEHHELHVFSLACMIPASLRSSTGALPSHCGPPRKRALLWD